MAKQYIGIPRELIKWFPTIDEEKCTGCGECFECCPNGVFELSTNDGKMKVVNPYNCVVLCDKCAQFCVSEAISFPDKEETKKIVSNYLKNRNK